MSRELFSHPLEITGYRFDGRGRGYPARISIDGRPIRVEPGTVEGTLSFRSNGMYFWIAQRGRHWRIIEP